MANDNTSQEGAENKEQKHSIWKDIISEEAGKLNTEFPLSGGETEEDLDNATGSTGDTDNTEKPAAEHHSLAERLMDDLMKINTEFPLSGGETEEDFEAADDKEEGED